MKLFFYPAIALMNRLGYTRKFALMGLLVLIAITLLAYSLFVSLDTVIRTSRQQLESISLIQPISRTMQNIQLHRGLSAALRGGNEAIRNSYVANEKETIGVINTLETRLPASLSASEDWRDIKTSWETLLKDGLNWTATENFNAHSRLISQIQLFVVMMAQTQGTEADLFYLSNIATNELPRVIEQIGQIRAYGATILTEKQITGAQERHMRDIIANLNNALTPIAVNFDKAARRNPALQNAFSVASRNTTASAQEMISLVESDIFTGHFTTSVEDFLMIASGVIDYNYSNLYESLLPAIEALIHTRIAQAESALHTSICIAMLLFVVVVYFSTGSYYATIASIQSLARSARAFAGGDMHTRIDLDTRDELRQVGNSFNEMADGFNALLEAHKQTEEDLQLKALLLDSSTDSVFVLDLNGKFVYLNKAAWESRGYTQDEMMGIDLRTLDTPEYAQMVDTRIREITEKGSHTFESAHRCKDGSVMPIEISARLVETGGRKLILSVIRDITERKQAEEKMLNLAYYDTLTGLPNRTLFYDRLAQEIKKAHRANLKMALLFIDLDKFKEINDTLGHSMGDLLLKEAAQRISDCVREADTVARLGGDEFIVILSELEDAGSIERVAENILYKLAEPFRLGDEVAYISASMGATLYPDDATQVEKLLKDADQAMYVAKSTGRNRLSYFTPELELAAQSRLHLLNDLRIALAIKQFRVYYQPIVDLTTGCIHKAEALIRWQHPQRGLVSPAEFIPLAEETGLIVEIGDWVFREAARQVKQWRNLYDPEFQVSVNKSPTQFRQSGTAHEVWLDYLRELGLPGQSIAIEITEGLLLGAEPGVTDKLLEFRDAGMQVSVDDFGTGYSSLSYLKKFDIDYLKIDRSFVRDLATDPNDMALSEAIIVMAHKLGLKVVAEGVETETQLALLAQAGCDYAQGYLFSKPVPAEEFEVLLKSGQPLNPEYYARS
ncbi:MAG TPA: EAL domain-containing protein [Gallionella sp.]|nr:EAL domain-containing protein [Gallionella sp.]